MKIFICKKYPKYAYNNQIRGGFLHNDIGVLYNQRLPYVMIVNLYNDEKVFGYYCHNDATFSNSDKILIKHVIDYRIKRQINETIRYITLNKESEFWLELMGFSDNVLMLE